MHAIRVYSIPKTNHDMTAVGKNVRVKRNEQLDGKGNVPGGGERKTTGGGGSGYGECMLTCNVCFNVVCCCLPCTIFV